MSYFDSNLAVRGSEEIGLIGNGCGYGIIDENGGVLMATFSKFVDTTNEVKRKFQNELFKIDMEGKTETKQFYVRDTAIFVTKIIGLRDEITIHHYYWKRLGHKCDDILMQEIAINRGQPQITITLTPKIDGKVLKAEDTFDHSVRYRDYVLSVSQGKIVNYIVDSKTFELKKKIENCVRIK